MDGADVGMEGILQRSVGAPERRSEHTTCSEPTSVGTKPRKDLHVTRALHVKSSLAVAPTLRRSDAPTLCDGRTALGASRPARRGVSAGARLRGCLSGGCVASRSLEHGWAPSRGHGRGCVRVAQQEQQWVAQSRHAHVIKRVPV